MLIDKSHKSWALFSLGVLLAAVAYYAFYYSGSYENGGNGPGGESWTGLTYGVVGFAMMLFCGLLGLRKRVRIWRLGRAQTWLKAHLWFGLLSFPIIFMHGGLQWGTGPLTFTLMLLFLIVEVSGILGVILQNTLPRYMLSRIPAEATFEQIPQVVGVLRDEADGMIGKVCGDLGLMADVGAELPGGSVSSVKTNGKVKGRVVKAKKKGKGPVEGSGPLKSFYLKDVRPYLDLAFKGETRMATSQGTIALFEHARTLVPVELHETLVDLESVCEERRQIAVQQRLHFWLHSWLFIHIPLSYALLVLSTFHAINATLYY